MNQCPTPSSCGASDSEKFTDRFRFHGKAAAKELKRPEEEVTFDEIVKFYSKRQKNQYEIFDSQAGTKAA